MTERRTNFHFTDFNWSGVYDCRESPEFQSCDCSWKLTFCLRSGCFMADIRMCTPSAVRNVMLSFVVRIRKADSIECKETTGTKIFRVSDNEFQIFLPLPTYDYGEDKGPLPITWTIKDLDKLVCQSSQTTEPMGRLVGDLRHLLHSGDESDATFHVKGREFRVHKAILAARSEVFFAMFKDDVADRASGVLYVVDCDPNTFQKFLEYIYTGKVDDLTPENAIRLYKAAYNYRIEELREECLECIKNSLSVECFFHIFKMMLEQGPREQIIEIVTDFFFYNWREIIRTVEWRTFSLENHDEANKLHQEALRFEKNMQTKWIRNCEEEVNRDDSCATFRMEGDGSLNTKPFEAEVTGILKEYNYTDCVDFEWKIPSIFRSSKCKKILCTPVFSSFDNSWELYLNLQSIQKAGGMRVDLRRKSHYNGNFFLNCTVAVKKKDAHGLSFPVMAESKIQLFCDKNDHMELLLNVREDNLEEFLSSLGGLTITWTMERPINKSSQTLQPGIDRLVQDLTNLLFDGNGSDATIRIKEREFPVHRAILSARSNVFSAMFRHDMAERSCGVVDIQDCDPDTFWRFLRYVYTGETEHLIPKNDSVLYAIQLYEVADKYQVEELREECLETIKRGLSAKSFWNVLTFTFKHDEIEEAVGIAKFFSQNYEEIIETVEWKSFSFDCPERAKMLIAKRG